ncbi:hypothetical protein ACIQ4Z_23455 [Peribacillus asahii]|uniref:hypothetical protein n=1 Tax=Peribacillus asahii TaxID=228899 RepID=UPI0038180AB7
MNMFVEAKFQFHTILEQVFLGCRKVFLGSIFKGFFIDIKEISHFRGRINSRESKLAESVIEFCSSQWDQWAWKNAKK